MSSVGAHDAKLFPTIPHLSIPRIDSYRRLLGRKSPLTNRGTDGRTPLLCQSNEVQPSSAFYSFPDLVFWVSLLIQTAALLLYYWKRLVDRITKLSPILPCLHSAYLVSIIKPLIFEVNSWVFHQFTMALFCK